MNALLSLGYTVLYNHISTALIAFGLNPRIGLFHQQRGTYHALACDLQEEFRHLVDAQVWSMISRKELKPPIGLPSPSQPRTFILDREVVRAFLSAMERRLLTSFTPPGGQSIHYRAFIDRQARAVRGLMQGQSRYDPLRVRG